MKNSIDINLTEQNCSSSEVEKWLLSLTNHAVQFNELENFSNQIRFGEQKEELVNKSRAWRKVKAQLKTDLKELLDNSESVSIKYQIIIERGA
jgi:hypothetical protein